MSVYNIWHFLPENPLQLFHAHLIDGDMAYSTLPQCFVNLAIWAHISHFHALIPMKHGDNLADYILTTREMVCIRYM